MKPRRTPPRPALQKVSDAAPEAIIEMRGVVKKFSNAAGEFTVLKGVNVQINRGEFVSIVGKSGSGKSTLLNMITGIDRPSEGQVIVNHNDIYTGVSESARSKWRGKNLGIVFQFFQLLPMLTLLENVMLPMDYVDMYDFDERPARAMELLKLVGLEKFANKLPILVSTGQQQLAAIARAMACDPPLLIADEPTGNLDTRSSDAIIALFEQFVSRGKTIVMVTHDPSLTSRTHRNIIISDGETIDEAISRSLPQLRHRHMLEFTKLAERKTYQPRETILSSDQKLEYFYIIRRGEVEVVLQARRNKETVLSRLGADEFFGEIELLRGGKSIANIRAGSEPVELTAIPRADFTRVMDESPITAETLSRIVQKRLEQHRMADPRTRK
ncbi:ATP-binding cassette domain-containing protein [Chloroflexi bacterium CFX5]|nr:ATP-binding cassette domain-containing protein [Anaerolineales bacterium]MDL1919417.1 ATP-binding cassette domain-containing protein [Chloroflexi bacterium CFX5]NUQ58190.1 ATP-binding cassette domain-containing protein [Anaerolineales bacterium]